MLPLNVPCSLWQSLEHPPADRGVYPVKVPGHVAMMLRWTGTTWSLPDGAGEGGDLEKALTTLLASAEHRTLGLWFPLPRTPGEILNDITEENPATESFPFTEQYPAQIVETGTAAQSEDLLWALRADISAIMKQSRGVSGFKRRGRVSTWQWLLGMGHLNGYLAVKSLRFQVKRP